MEPITAIAGASAISGIGQSIGNYFSQRAGYKFQKKYAKNAMQWRVNDLKKAGLSPVLATGSASPSGAINVSPPKMEGLPESAINALQLATMAKGIDKTDAEITATKMQAEKLGSEVSLNHSRKRSEDQNRHIAWKNRTTTTGSGIFRDMLMSGQSVADRS